MAHIQAHSPNKPETVRRSRQVLDHFERLTGHRKHVEAITRGDIDDYKIGRQRLITPPAINFEVSTVRTFLYYLRYSRLAGRAVLTVCVSPGGKRISTLTASQHGNAVCYLLPRRVKLKCSIRRPRKARSHAHRDRR